MEHLKSSKKITTNSQRKRNNKLYLLIAGVLSLVLISCLNSLIFNIFFTEQAGATTNKYSSFLSVFMLLVGSPFLEETIFRAIFLAYLLKKTNKIMLSSIIVSVGFALLHIQPYYYLPCFLASLVLNQIYINSDKNLKLCLAVHSISNGILLLLTL